MSIPHLSTSYAYDAILGVICPFFAPHRSFSYASSQENEHLTPRNCVSLPKEVLR